jgi:hypothetical protein
MQFIQIFKNLEIIVLVFIVRHDGTVMAAVAYYIFILVIGIIPGFRIGARFYRKRHSERKRKVGT